MKSILLFLSLLVSQVLYAQNDPVLSIDGVNTTFKSGLSLPYWLKAGQTLGIVTNVKSVSILEFSADTSNLKFSQVISLTTTQTVPAGKAWKIEGLGLGINGTAISGFSGGTPSIFTSPKTFNTPGTFDWIVPPGITNICVEVWGAGGGAAYISPQIGGGGGAYGYECFTVVPGTHYSVIIGNGGYYSANQDGGYSALGNLIQANGGLGGINGGSGGTSNAQYNIPGENASYSGGLAGNSYAVYGTGGTFNGGNGYGGRLIIYW